MQPILMPRCDLKSSFDFDGLFDTHRFPANPGEFARAKAGAKRAEPVGQISAQRGDPLLVSGTRRTATAAAAAAIAIAAPAAATAGAFFARAGFVYSQGAAFQVFAGQAGNGRLRAFRRGHANEGKAARTARGAVGHEIDLINRTAGCEEILQIVFGDVEGQIPDE
jgi:hypothetical protein